MCKNLFDVLKRNVYIEVLSVDVRNTCLFEICCVFLKNSLCSFFIRIHIHSSSPQVKYFSAVSSGSFRPNPRVMPCYTPGDIRRINLLYMITALTDSPLRYPKNRKWLSATHLSQQFFLRNKERTNLIVIISMGTKVNAIDLRLRKIVHDNRQQTTQ